MWLKMTNLKGNFRAWFSTARVLILLIFNISILPFGEIFFDSVFLKDFSISLFIRF